MRSGCKAVRQGTEWWSDTSAPRVSARWGTHELVMIPGPIGARAADHHDIGTTARSDQTDWREIARWLRPGDATKQSHEREIGVGRRVQMSGQCDWHVRRTTPTIQICESARTFLCVTSER